MTTHEILLAACSVKRLAATLTTEQKQRALAAMANAIAASRHTILAANAEDVAAARGTVSEVMIDRLTLTEDRILAMADGVRAVASLPDPVGHVLFRAERPNGLVIEKTAVPIGVVAIIYESRPNVTSDAAALTLMSGNVSVLRGGKEAYRSSHAIVSAMRAGLSEVGLPCALVSLLEDATRAGAKELMGAVGYVDLLIPRGGAGLIRAVTEQAKVPCIETGTGICHIYVDRSADMEMALSIVENAKTSRPSVCNAAEVCLVHEEIAEKFLPLLSNRLVDARLAAGKPAVELRLDRAASRFISGRCAEENDFDTEFLDYILAVSVVPSIDAAIDHIAAHSTRHSEAIVTEDREAAALFTACVDSAAVYVNASTRFTDGGEFGLGCEMGISTQRLHARGPMGLFEMTTYKYIVRGNGQVR